MGCLPPCLFSLPVSLPLYQPPEACSSQSVGMKGGLKSLTARLLVTTSGFPISCLWGDTGKRDKRTKCPTTVREGLLSPSPKPFSLFQPPAQPSFFLLPHPSLHNRRVERNPMCRFLHNFFVNSSGFNFIFYFKATKLCFGARYQKNRWFLPDFHMVGETLDTTHIHTSLRNRC